MGNSTTGQKTTSQKVAKKTTKAKNKTLPAPQYDENYTPDMITRAKNWQLMLKNAAMQENKFIETKEPT